MTTTHMVTWTDGPEGALRMQVFPTRAAADTFAAERRAAGNGTVDVWANVTGTEA